ncbi:MAG: hypothetical protein KTM48_00130 [Wolbachia endosymbiont of Pissodes strobi]|nr:hypothetical protein [Wolbachia endosymbiont of Pissodes strobi]
MSAVLFQEDPHETKHIISYSSAKFSSAARRYHINEQQDALSCSGRGYLEPTAVHLPGLINLNYSSRSINTTKS